MIPKAAQQISGIATGNRHAKIRQTDIAIII
jgi:hypothetical protein